MRAPRQRLMALGLAAGLLMAPPPERAPVGGLLLSGGASRRMGFDKALLPVEGQANAVRLAGALRRVALGPVLEVGPARSGLPAVQEQPAGSGPLAAVVAGWLALCDRGWQGPVVVVACDLPLLNETALSLLARWPGTASVVPCSEGQPQPLCARWAAGDLAVARRLVSEGRRSLKALLEAVDFQRLEPPDWPSALEGVLADVDTPEDLRRLGLRPPA